MRIGLISDTHGLLRPEALDALAGSSAIVHAGDVGKQAVLDGLARVAPVHAIRGNVDRAGPTSELPDTLDLELGGVRIHVVHDGKTASPPAGTDVVVCGHSHKPSVEARDGVLWINPGSAGPRRFSLPVCTGWLIVEGGRVRAEQVELQVAPPRSRRRR